MLNRAVEIARKALSGMVDEQGQPYIEHTLRVISQMDTEEEKIAAALHDVVEDSEISLRDLQEEGFPREILETVGMLTKRSDMTYFDYIDDISCGSLAAKIKIAEIEDNQDEKRVAKMSFRTYNKEDRASRALKILRGQNNHTNYK
ncbi:MAG: hypothetical protein ACRDBO_01830 [Lachnospiraceae bacterium]